VKYFIRTCFILKKYIIFVETFKQNNMQTIETTTGKTRKELETLYTQAVKMLVEFGATPEQAREIARQSFKDAMGL
jgi:hypothetical protein